MKDKAKKWTKEEENFVLAQLKVYKSVADLPLASMSQKMGRTSDSIRKKAGRLHQAKDSIYIWDKEESQEAFLLYLQELPLAEILKQLHDQGSTATLDQLEIELKRMREAWSKHIRTYAEERQLPTAKHFKLNTIKFYIENRLTASDFVRKVLHGKIKNG